MSFIILIFSILITLFAQFRVNSQFKKAGKIKSLTGNTGYQTAKKILDAYGLSEVEIVKSSGSLSDYYDSRSKVLALSEDVYSKDSLAAIAVAAHECGHALQDKYNYSYLTLRQRLYPLVNVSSKLSYFLIIASIFFSSTGLLDLGIIAFTVSVLFTLITLPVEFDASSRALKVIQELNLVVDQNELNVSKKVLDAAALTYVAAFITSVLELVRLILISSSND